MRSKITSVAHNHRAVVPLHDSPSSYFVTITVPTPPKIRIKIPKLLAKTMQKRFDVHNKDGNNAKSSADQHDEDDHNTKRSVVAMRKVRSLFANVFGNHEALESRKHGKKGSFYGENVVKRVGFGFAKGRSRKFVGQGIGNKGAVSKRVVVIGRREGARKLLEASKRAEHNRGTFGVVRSLRAIGSKRFDLRCLDLNRNGVDEERDSLELCKKRILMGSKCKPLTISGSLHYDNNGILLPEAIP